MNKLGITDSSELKYGENFRFFMYNNLDWWMVWSDKNPATATPTKVEYIKVSYEILFPIKSSNGKESVFHISLKDAIENGHDEITINKDLTIDEDLTIPEGKTLIIPENGTLTIAEDVVIDGDGLVEKNGKIIPSQIAKDISENYIEVMVDEYQDINDIQNTIFKMVTKNEKNLFMVGDVKQSIYKFRQSRPQIFLEKKDAFSSYNPESEIYPAKISLGKNFRSKKEILDFVNFIFENIMSKETGEIEYNHEEFLIPGINSEENPKNHVE